MLFWLFVIIAILGASLYFIGQHFGNWHYAVKESRFVKWLYYNDDNFIITGAVMFWLATAAIIFSLIAICTTHSEAPGLFAANTARYEALTYKMKSPTCRDEFGFLSKEIIDEVQDWNEDLAQNKIMQRNFWVGIYIPNIYDQFEFIDYHSYVPLGGG